MLWADSIATIIKGSKMKPPKEILEMYGKCCVSEYALSSNRKYPDGDEGKQMRRRDDEKLADIEGQKKIIEWIFE